MYFLGAVPNLLRGFREFQGEQEAPGMLNVMKQQQRIPKKLWKGMPFQIPANKKINLDGKTFTGPMTFFVTDSDDSTVTLKLVRNAIDFTNADDPDDEIDTDNTNDGGEQTFVVPRDVFEKLLEPANFNGADYQTASQSMATR